ncbi:MAG: metallophosphoesterase, partial [Syntrophales bacterium]|nr:metallophosphoesterase [Syntrophales bacterium]
MGRIFAIGDVHGCRQRLEALVDRIPLDYDGDTLVFVGDYIDRGPDSKAVVDFILELCEDIRHVVCLRGNHEQMFLNYINEGRDQDLYFFNGGL